MSTSASSVRFDEDKMWVELTDGRTVGVPLVWFPRLLNASEGQREDYTVSAYGIHWESIDEDISVNALLAGKGDQTVSGQRAA